MLASEASKAKRVETRAATRLQESWDNYYTDYDDWGFDWWPKDD